MLQTATQLQMICVLQEVKKEHIHNRIMQFLQGHS